MPKTNREFLCTLFDPHTCSFNLSLIYRFSKEEKKLIFQKLRAPAPRLDSCLTKMDEKCVCACNYSCNLHKSLIYTAQNVYTKL